MAGDDSGLAVCRQRDDSVSGLSQDGAGLLTTQDPLKEEETERGRSLKPRGDLLEVNKSHSLHCIIITMSVAYANILLHHPAEFCRSPRVTAVDG